MKRVLLVDGTGRGHALCDLFVRTCPEVHVFYGPGSALVQHPRVTHVPSIALHDPRTALRFVAATPVDCVFVAHIDALSSGYVDALRAAGVAVVGPTRAAAQLEASKARGKAFCQAHGLPTAAWRAFCDTAAAHAHIEAQPGPCVVKADGLTPDGDGAVICRDAAAAHAAVDCLASLAGGVFTGIIEELLEGDEISLFALLDGESCMLFPTARDYKRTHDGDHGKNCDGMGSISPHPRADAALHQEAERVLFAPLLAGLAREGLDFTGFVYVGAMITAAGLKVIEINARFGDSEAEVVLPAVRTSFAALCAAVLSRALSSLALETDGLQRCTVALTQGAVGDAPGWPFGAVPVGQRIHGLAAAQGDGARVFFANAALDGAGHPVTAGGRVLHVLGQGTTLAQARACSYAAVRTVRFAGMRHRNDIGLQGASS